MLHPNSEKEQTKAQNRLKTNLLKSGSVGKKEGKGSGAPGVRFWTGTSHIFLLQRRLILFRPCWAKYCQQMERDDPLPLLSTSKADSSPADILLYRRLTIFLAAVDKGMWFYSVLVWPYLDCWVQFWASQYKCKIWTDWKMSNWCHKMMNEWEHLSCWERLIEL